MSDQRKNAYRYLLYHAMPEIRRVAWQRSSRSFFFQSAEVKQQTEYSRYAGEVADWLHNLAMYSAMDFARFDEVTFWLEYRSLQKRQPKFREQLKQYRLLFKQRR